MIRCEQLTLRRGSRVLIEQASFELHAGQRCALTGANGSGKSSLFALIRGELEADAGQCRIPESWVIAHVAQETPALPHSALEHVLLGDPEWLELCAQLQNPQLDDRSIAQAHERFEQIGGWETEARAARLLHGLGFAQKQLQQAVKDFSGGWRMRLNLAQALLCRSDLLLLDEPTNHLDLEAILWLENWLKRYPGTLLLISHDRNFLDAICTHVLHLENQRLHAFRGNYSQSEQKRLEQQRLLRKQAEKTEAARAHMADFVRRFRAKASKARQAQSRLKALEKLAPVMLARPQQQLPLEFPQPEQQPSPLLVLEGADLGWQRDHPVLTGVELTLLPGEKLGLLGPNGAGKSTLLKTLAGELEPLSGRQMRPRALSVGYFAQHQIDRLHPEQTATAHLQQQTAWSEQQCWDYLGRFRFSQEQAEQPVCHYSGGERARLALALVIQQAPNLLLLDEPTNHLDMETREALAMALNRYEGAVVLISHDRNLLQLCCEGFLCIQEGRLKPWNDTLEAWLQQLPQTRRNPSDTEDSKAARGNDARQRRQQAAQVRAQLQPLKKSVHQLEQQMNRLQKELAGIDHQLLDEKLYTEAEKNRLQNLLQTQGQLRQQLQAIEEQWLLQAEQLETRQQALLHEARHKETD